MEAIYTVEWMKQVARNASASGRLVGFVPTMGALHEGHFSLIREAKKNCSPVVVSIFVNPLQFGPQEDLGRYPRMMEEDQAALRAAGVDYLFAPTPAEMYPRGFRTHVQVDGLSERLEGRTRPGHFRGVTTVVLKLLEIVRPQSAFFGRKDAQQARILRQMAEDLQLDSRLVICPIVREEDGVALSSRNRYLSAEERIAARALQQSLCAAREAIARGERDCERLKEKMREVFSRQPLVAVDYAEIVGEEDFEPARSLRGNGFILVAAYVGKTRLIDNAFVEHEGGSFRVTV